MSRAPTTILASSSSRPKKRWLAFFADAAQIRVRLLQARAASSRNSRASNASRRSAKSTASTSTRPLQLPLPGDRSRLRKLIQ
eukprot:12102459-Heterocapsa_arctica.AAC.1